MSPKKKTANNLDDWFEFDRQPSEALAQSLLWQENVNNML